MPDYILSCCSTADLSEDFLLQHGIAYINFNYDLDGVPCKDDFGKTHSPADLYTKMLAGAVAHTSQISVGEYIDFWKPFLEKGQDILHVTLSSGISGTYNSACTARDELRLRYPKQQIFVVDSLAASAGYGLLMDKLARLKAAGMKIEDLATWAQDHRLEVQHWFFSSDLRFFIKGGRISKGAGLVGGLLKICPVMSVAADGSLKVIEKIRTKKAAQKRLVELMKELATDGQNYSQNVFISNSECIEDARGVGNTIEHEFAHMQTPLLYFNIGATIGCHTGPGTVALFYWGKSRADMSL